MSGYRHFWVHFYLDSGTSDSKHRRKVQLDKTNIVGNVP